MAASYTPGPDDPGGLSLTNGNPRRDRGRDPHHGSHSRVATGTCPPKSHQATIGRPTRRAAGGCTRCPDGLRGGAPGPPHRPPGPAHHPVARSVDPALPQGPLPQGVIVDLRGHDVALHHDGVTSEPTGALGPRAPAPGSGSLAARRQRRDRGERLAVPARPAADPGGTVRSSDTPDQSPTVAWVHLAGRAGRWGWVPVEADSGGVVAEFTVAGLVDRTGEVPRARGARDRTVPSMAATRR